MVIGKRLKFARETIGLTLEQAAKEGKIDVALLRKVEKGKGALKFSHLSKLAEIYMRPVKFFFAEPVSVNEVMLWCNGSDIYQKEKQDDTKSLYNDQPAAEGCNR